MRSTITSSAVLLIALVHTSIAASLSDLIGSSLTSLTSTQDEASYTLVRKGQDYEERQYPAQTWVCKKHTGSLTSSAQQEAFLSLFDYLAGDNKQNLAMDMAIPASVKAPANREVNEYEACFYPGHQYQQNTPEPTNTELYVLQRPAMTIFSRKFGGYASEENTWREQTARLTKSLEAAKEPHGGDNYFWNAFNSPLQFWNRRNEVWILKKQ